MPERPLILFCPPQASSLDDLDRSPAEGPAMRGFMDAAFAEAGLDYVVIPPNRRPWNPFAGVHAAYEGVDPLRALRLLLTRRRVAAVVTFTESPALVLAWLRRVLLYRPPVILWEVPWSAGWAYRAWLGRMTVPRVDRVVVCGSNQLELLRQVYGRTEGNAFLPSHVDVDFFHPMPRDPAGTPGVLSVGFDAGRDFAILAEATKGLDVPVTIKAGRHPIALDLSVHPNLELIERYLSYVDFRRLYADAAMVVVSTLETPNACGVTSLLEALAMGRPTIVSDNPALRDYLPPADAAIVVPVGDRDALRAAILGLLADPGRAAEMGRRGREFVVRHFAPPDFYRRMAAYCWETALAAGTARRQG
jgi:glycosyltransferase involved in cell wall biosynthesis